MNRQTILARAAQLHAAAMAEYADRVPVDLADSNPHDPDGGSDYNEHHADVSAGPGLEDGLNQALAGLFADHQTAKVDEGPAGDVRAGHLIGWFNKGADGKIAWGTDGDFEECVRIAGQYMSEGKAKGFCANRHHDVTGIWPGPHAHGG